MSGSVGRYLSLILDEALTAAIAMEVRG
jgi:hypothetical protein